MEPKINTKRFARLYDIPFVQVPQTKPSTQPAQEDTDREAKTSQENTTSTRMAQDQQVPETIPITTPTKTQVTTSHSEQEHINEKKTPIDWETSEAVTATQMMQARDIMWNSLLGRILDSM